MPRGTGIVPRGPIFPELGKAMGKSFLAGALFYLGTVVAERLWNEALEYFSKAEKSPAADQTPKAPQT